MKSVGRGRGRQAGGSPGRSLLAVSVPPACLYVFTSASLAWLSSPLSLSALSHLAWPSLPFMAAHPPLSPHAGLFSPHCWPPNSAHWTWSASSLHKLPSFLYLSVLSPTCPLNFISKRVTTRLPFDPAFLPVSPAPAAPHLSGPPRSCAHMEHYRWTARADL